VNNGQTSTPAYPGQNVQGNPTANAYTGTQYNGQASQTSQMPTQAVNPTALAYSGMNEYQHGGSQAAAFGYMDPQYAQQGYNPAFPMQPQQQAPHEVAGNPRVSQ
jgi:hypothetical protein